MEPNDDGVFDQTQPTGGAYSASDPSTNSAAVPGGATCGAKSASDMFRREVGDVDPGRLALVKRLQASVRLDLEHWKPDFERMKKDENLLRYGAEDSWVENKLYAVNIIARVVKSIVDGLYAKNPTLVVSRRKTLDFKIWDGSEATLQAAGANMAANMALIQDVMQGASRRRMMDGLAQTIKIVADYELARQSPAFKVQMKRVVRRAVVCGVGYVKLGYQREMTPTPEVVTLTSELTARLANIERMVADKHDNIPGSGDETAEAAELAIAMAEIKSQPLQVSSEGMRFDFPHPNTIIPHRTMKCLTGFEGCDYVTEQFLWSSDTIKELFGVDVQGAGVKYYDGTTMDLSNSQSSHDAQEADSRLVAVWLMYHRKDGVMYWMVDGYRDFLSDPAPPPIVLERFYPWFPLSFSVTDNEKHPFPVSVVSIVRGSQQEYNRSRQGLRDHRIANRPKYATPRGLLDEEDQTKLTTADAHELVQLNGLAPGQKIEDVLQRVRHDGIDPNLYDVQAIFQDILRSVGVQDADMGNTSGATATETSIAENARSGGVSSNMDDLDMVLMDVFREMGRVLLLEMDTQTVMEIAGPGATWPQISPEDVLEDLSLEIDAGSSGRPNAAAEAAKFQQLAPILMQIPGIRPDWLAREAIKRMDDKLDPSDAILDGLPSMMAMAQLHAAGGLGAGVGAGPPGSAPPQGVQPGGPPGPPGPPPGPSGPPGAPPMGIQHPQAAMGGMMPHPGPPPQMQGGHGGLNVPSPAGAVFRPPAYPAPGPGIVPMGGA
jgi:hypothetical protein